jgi:hypothetical protein
MSPQFLPVIGRLVVDSLQGTLDPALARKFALDRPFQRAFVTGEDEQDDPSRPRGSKVQVLKEGELCTDADLLPPATTK